MMQKLKRPEEVFQFKPFYEAVDVVHEMGVIYRDLLDKSLPRETAFVHALRQTHMWLHEELSVITDGWLYHRFREEFIKTAGKDVRGVIQDFLRPYTVMLSRHGFERVCLDPASLLEAATAPPSFNGAEGIFWGLGLGDALGRFGDEQEVREYLKSIAYRKYFDCLRRMVIAIQYFSIEMTDSDARSSEDLLLVEELAAERLFSATDEVVWVVAVLNQESNRVEGSPMVFLDRDQYESKIRELQKSGVNYYDDRYSCRIVQMDGMIMLIYVNSRWKEMRPMLLKLERGRRLTDRRGWKYVVVATMESGRLRVGEHADAVLFSRYCKDHLWVHPLSKSGGDRDENPNSHPDYKDVKIVGRIRSRYGDEPVSAQVEQITMTLEGHINTLTSRDGVNHDIYRGQAIVLVLCARWFPRLVHDIAWPTTFDGVHSDPSVELTPHQARQLEVAKTLYTWWLSQIVNHTRMLSL